eukprot:336025-Pelagomonas_calceolata.AAC.3
MMASAVSLVEIPPILKRIASPRQVFIFCMGCRGCPSSWPSTRAILFAGAILCFDAGAHHCGQVRLPSFLQGPSFALMQVPIIVAKYAGRPECMAKVEEAIRVQQNNDQAVQHGMAAARIMEKVMLDA